MQDVLKIAVSVFLAVLQLAVPVLAIVGIVFLFRRTKDPVRRSRILKRAGLGIMAALALFFGAFVIGETLSDPGGWQSVGLISAWWVPLAVVSLVAWFRPLWGVSLLTVLTAGVLALEAWAAFDEDIRALEDRIGPFTMIAMIAVAIAVAALGHSRPTFSGNLLLIVGSAPFLFSLAATVAKGGAGREGPPLVLYATVGAPMVLAGLLLVMSDRISHRGSPQTREPNRFGQKEAA